MIAHVPAMAAGPGEADRRPTQPSSHLTAVPRPAGGGAPVRGRPASPADALTGPVTHTERAVIGDKLRVPSVWCDLAPCISHYRDPAALGQADVRARAVAAGWRVDALGRLACPACQQTGTRFRATRQVMRWERDAAITMATLMVAGFDEQRRAMTGFAEETAVLPVLPAAVLPPGSGRGPGRAGRGRRRAG